MISENCVPVYLKRITKKKPQTKSPIYTISSMSDTRILHFSNPLCPVVIATYSLQDWSTKMRGTWSDQDKKGEGRKTEAVQNENREKVSQWRPWQQGKERVQLGKPLIKSETSCKTKRAVD